MKLELAIGWLFVATMGSAGALSGNPETIPMLGATLAGGSVAGAWSVLKSRKRHANSTDTALWAYIAMIGSMGLAFSFAPWLSHRAINLGDVGVIAMPEAPPIAFVLALSGTPIIEGLAGGWLWEKFRDLNPFAKAK